jgi:hypothetical protein
MPADIKRRKSACEDDEVRNGNGELINRKHEEHQVDFGAVRFFLGRPGVARYWQDPAPGNIQRDATVRGRAQFAPPANAAIIVAVLRQWRPISTGEFPSGKKRT